MTMVNGIGTRLYGRTWHHDGSYYITTEWFCILWLPIYPIRSFKIYSGTGVGNIASAHEKGEREVLPNLYLPHLKAYLFTAGVVFIAAVWIWSGPVSESDLEKQSGYLENEAGLVALEMERYDAAVTLFEEAVKADPANSVYYYNLALAHSLTGDYEESLNQLNSAVILAPKKIPLYVAQAKVLGAMGDFSAAAEACKKGLEIETDNSELLKLSGDYSTLAGNYAAAVNAYTRMIDADRYEYQPYLDRAYAYYLADESESGLVDIETAQARDPNVAEIKYVKALILLDLGRDTEAGHLLRKIIDDSTGLSPEQIQEARRIVKETGPR